MPIPSAPLRPLAEVTTDNHGAVVSVTAFVLLSITVIIVLIKSLSMIYLKRVVLSVDVPIWTSTIIALVQSILIQFAVDHGLGMHRDVLSSSIFDTYNQLIYVAELLTFSVLSLTKISTSNLIRLINANQSIDRSNKVTQIVILGWTVLAHLGYAFQCQTPHWRYIRSQCVGEVRARVRETKAKFECYAKVCQGAIMYWIMTINMLIDVVLVVLPTIMLWNVQISFARRLKVMAAFASRTAVIVADAFQLSYLGQYLHSTDPTCWSSAHIEIRH
ncbi:uncharacterized protein BDW43DRAFT_285906 [Aspergillus alliaceus]|uniref:uncharacterized protein n=1 Tax=Petromyces alliaceus TaxID=209559 RepID=UPI0012A77658|nr:uncharacterized protein BDW43DRAFT_285906 [Aspergillus alliaceus]KAB8230418.1 hypothetical protein BDW43DRAFT_285906 [Aspergillus alliaceus]